MAMACKSGGDKSQQKYSETAAVVKVNNKNGNFQLSVNNEPFYIKGAGLEFGNVAALAKHNGNSFRTWRTDNGEKSGTTVLDEAQENGLMVAMGIELGSERHGFDYNDTTAVLKQKERVRKEVMELKDHPALLLWVIGNELNLFYTNPKVWEAVNDISKMIHEIDHNHPTTTTLAGIAKKEIDFIKEKAADLDILSFQMYGNLPDLPILVKDFGWDGPYIVTEWGATGHWEVPTTAWGAPIEENSSLKAANYLNRFQGAIATDTIQCLGSYVFLWGNKQERTPTWYGVFFEDGKETESVDVMHYIWNNKWPENRTPKIISYKLDGKTAYENIIIPEGKKISAVLRVNDIENDALTYRWEILPESTATQAGGDHEERPKKVNITALNQGEGVLVFYAPQKGNYRLFVYADDGHNHAATANIPFKVE